MAKLGCRSVPFLALASVVGVASAQSDNPWNGFYAGANAGGTRINACTRSTLNGATTDSASATGFSNCPSGGLVGGVQIGEDFQTKRLVWGIGADLDAWSAKDDNRSLK